VVSEVSPSSKTTTSASTVYNHGSIVLGTDDSLSYWVLVVTGPERGKVWLVTGVGAYPYPMRKLRSLGFGTVVVRDS
jgi:hypothetical protein